MYSFNKLKEQSFKDGIGICKAPGAELYNFVMQKMTDCLCDLEPGMKDEKGDLQKYKVHDPKNVETAMKKYGINGIKVLAVQTLVRTIKSHRAALNDMAAENDGEGMTQDEIIKENTQKLRMENQMHKEIQQPKLDNPVMQ
ncbi:MAG: hypothetical protein K6F91_00025 [Ruminococcus sp.]|nr:hypothetical protein [Ruminococcus sp.]